LLFTYASTAGGYAAVTKGLMVINMYKRMENVVIKILQGGAVTQTMLGGLVIYPPVANFF